MTWIHTRSGRRVSLANPEPDTITLADIASALGGVCRYTGHPIKHYSVAEHSVHVGRELIRRECSPVVVLSGYLHDAPEFVLTDLPHPLKVLMPPVVRAWWDMRESLVARAIELGLALPVGVVSNPPPIVGEIDTCILMNERVELLYGTFEDWPVQVERIPGLQIQCWDRDTASNIWQTEVFHAMRRL